MRAIGKCHRRADHLSSGHQKQHRYYDTKGGAGPPLGMYLFKRESWRPGGLVIRTWQRFAYFCSRIEQGVQRNRPRAMNLYWKQSASELRPGWNFDACGTGIPAGSDQYSTEVPSALTTKDRGSTVRLRGIVANYARYKVWKR